MRGHRSKGLRKPTGQAARQFGFLASLAQKIASEERQYLAEMIFSATKGQVISGPFEGLQMVFEQSWINDLGSKLLGSYEEQLHEVILQTKSAGYANVINVGCAEGYYAIGLARLLPNAKVFAFDIDEKAQLIVKDNARLNRVHDRVRIGGKCTARSLNKLLSDEHHSLIVMDVEGAEKDLLDPKKAPRLTHVDMLIECHDLIGETITELLEERFSSTHVISRIMDGPRNPHKYELLRPLPDLMKWNCLCENRQSTMNWLFLSAKRPYAKVQQRNVA
jgi:hypothetical protein